MILMIVGKQLEISWVGERERGDFIFLIILLVQTLNVLTLNMEQKSRNYESPVLAAVFLLNNYSFIHSTFTRCIFNSNKLPSFSPPLSQERAYA